MSAEHQTIRARFGLRFRCANCRLTMERELISPDLDDAPADVEELMGSNLLTKQFYPCEACDNPVSTLIAVKMLEPGEVFQKDTPGARLPTSSERARAGLLPSPRRRRFG